MGDLQQTNVRAGQKAHNAKYDEQQILPQAPVESSQTRFVPVHDNLNDGREHETEGAQADGTNQRDKRPQIGHGSGQCNGENLYQNLSITYTNIYK